MPLNLPRIRELMDEQKSAGTSQRAVADRMGVSGGYLCNFLAGRIPNPTLRRLESLATALGVKASSLIE